MIVKRVSILDGLDGPLVPLATFFMDGDAVVATYHSESYREELEETGIGLVVDGKFRIMFPADGKVFFDALSRAYSRSTFMVVQTTDEPDPPGPAGG